MPKIINVEQGSDAWHAARLKHIGASEIATILNMDPFGNRPFGLWMEKTGRKKRSTYESDNQKHGHDNEEKARMAYVELAGEFAVPTMLECTRPGWEFMTASLDGMHADGKQIVEIKCPLEAGTMRDVKEGTLPDNYFAQVQAQLFVSEARAAHFFCWFRGEGIMLGVDPDEEFWNNEMLPAVKEFWRRVQENKWPMPTGELVINNHPEFKTWAEEMAGVIQLERDTKDRRLKLEAQGAREFFENYKRISGHGIEVNFTFKKGYQEKYPRKISDSLAMTIRRTE